MHVRVRTAQHKYVFLCHQFTYRFIRINESFPKWVAFIKKTNTSVAIIYQFINGQL